jgi:hypothetical protein
MMRLFVRHTRRTVVAAEPVSQATVQAGVAKRQIRVKREKRAGGQWAETCMECNESWTNEATNETYRRKQHVAKWHPGCELFSERAFNGRKPGGGKV